MAISILRDAFGHHIWATVRLLGTCETLNDEQLQSSVPGTYGSIIETLRHLVGADQAYLALLSGGSAADTDRMTVSEMRRLMGRCEKGWMAVLSANPDGDSVVVRYHSDGSTNSAPLGIRLSQVIHHGTDHRSQVCTALTSIGVEPPPIDVWDYADAHGRLAETEST